MGRVHSAVLAAALCALFFSSGVLAFQSSFQDEVANLKSPNVSTRVKAAKALGESKRLEAIP
ncbi:MAG TPA: hypothetical protein VIG29_02920, partial [Vicinamibacteria bacterium]